MKTFIEPNLVVHKETDVNGLEAGVSRQDGVVRFHNSRSHLKQTLQWISSVLMVLKHQHLRRWVDGKLEPGHLAVVGGDLLHEEGGEAGAGAAAKGMEHQEPLRKTFLAQTRDRWQT